MMDASICQIAFVFDGETRDGRHNDHPLPAQEHIAAVAFDRAVPEPFAALQSVAVKALSLGGTVFPSDVYFLYQDDDGDFVVIDSDLDAIEAFAVHEDAGQDDVLLHVKIRSSQSSSSSSAPLAATSAAAVKSDVDEDENGLASDAEMKAEDEKVPAAASAGGVHNLLDETFVLELCAFLSDPIVRLVLPEVGAALSAAVLKRATAAELYAIGVANVALREQKLLSQEWPFAQSWARAYDAWIATLTEEQLGKVAFQVPIVLARMVAKREKLHKAIFVKHKSLDKMMKVTQFDFGPVSFAHLLEEACKTTATAPVTGHVGSVCAMCKVAPIEGTLYKCMVCPLFDMCEACEAKGEHPADHGLMKLKEGAGVMGMPLLGDFYGKKGRKHQMKMMKKEAKLERKMMKYGKHGHHHGHHHHNHGGFGGRGQGGGHHHHHHGKFGRRHGHHGFHGGAEMPEYLACGGRFVDVLASAAGSAPVANNVARGNYGPVETPTTETPRKLY